AIHPVTFNSTGPKTVTVQINSVGGQTLGQIIQTTDFSVAVVPEFPIGAAVVSAAVIGFIVVIMRAKGLSIGSSSSSLFGTKGAP
nr:hypothetical protein [Thermoproteota archaeon]